MWRLLQEQKMQINCSDSTINRNQENTKNFKCRNKLNIPEKPFCTAACAKSDPRAHTLNNIEAADPSTFITLFSPNERKITNTYNLQTCLQKQKSTTKKDLESNSIVKQLKSRIQMLEYQAQSMAAELSNQRCKEDEYKNKIRTLEQYLQKNGNVLLNQPQNGVVECEYPKEKDHIKETNELRACICKLKSQKESYERKMRLKLLEGEKTNRDLMKKVKLLESKIASSSFLQKRNSDLNKEVQNMQEEKSEVTQKVRILRVKNYGLAAELEDIRTDLLTIQAENKFKMDSQINIFESKLSEERIMKEQLRYQITFLERVINEMEMGSEQERQQFRKELNNSIGKVCDMRLKNMELTKKFESLQNYVCELQMAKRQLQEKQDRIVIQMSKIMMETQNELKELKSSLVESTPVQGKEQPGVSYDDKQDLRMELDVTKEAISEVIPTETAAEFLADTETEGSIEGMEEGASTSENEPQSEEDARFTEEKTEESGGDSEQLIDEESSSPRIPSSINNDGIEAQPTIEVSGNIVYSLEDPESAKSVCIESQSVKPEETTSISAEKVRKSEDSAMAENGVMGSTEDIKLSEYGTVEPAVKVIFAEHQTITPEKHREELSTTEIDETKMATTSVTDREKSDYQTSEKEPENISSESKQVPKKPLTEIFSSEDVTNTTEKPMETSTKSDVTTEDNIDIAPMNVTEVRDSKMSESALENISSQHAEDEIEVSEVLTNDFPVTELKQSSDQITAKTDNANEVSSNRSTTPVEVTNENLSISNIQNEERKPATKKSTTVDEKALEYVDGPPGNDVSEADMEHVTSAGFEYQEPEKEENLNTSKSKEIGGIYPGTGTSETIKLTDGSRIQTTVIEDGANENDVSSQTNISEESVPINLARSTSYIDYSKINADMETEMARDVREHRPQSKTSYPVTMSGVTCVPREYLDKNKTAETPECICTVSVKTDSSTTLRKKDRIPPQMVETKEDSIARINTKVGSETTNLDGNIGEKEYKKYDNAGPIVQANGKREAGSAKFTDTEVAGSEIFNDQSIQGDIDEKLAAMENNEDAENVTTNKTIRSSLDSEVRSGTHRTASDEGTGLADTDKKEDTKEGSDGQASKLIDEDRTKETKIEESSSSKIKAGKKISGVSVKLPNETEINFLEPKPSVDSVLEEYERPRSVRFSDVGVPKTVSRKFSSDTRFPNVRSPMAKPCTCKTTCPKKLSSTLTSNEITDETKGTVPDSNTSKSVSTSNSSTNKSEEKVLNGEITFQNVLESDKNSSNQLSTPTQSNSKLIANSKEIIFSSEDYKSPSIHIVSKQTAESNRVSLMKILCHCPKTPIEYRQSLSNPPSDRIPVKTTTTQNYFKWSSDSPSKTVNEIRKRSLNNVETPGTSCSQQCRRDENSINILFVKNNQGSSKISCRCQYMLDIITLSVENENNLNKMPTSRVPFDACECLSSRGIVDSDSKTSLQYVDGRRCSCNLKSTSYQFQSNEEPNMEITQAIHTETYTSDRSRESALCETPEDCKCLVSAVLDTVLRLTASLAVLQNKCRTKDRMIQSLADELNGRSLSGVFENLLTNLALDDSAFPTQPYDFDRIRLCEYLKKPTGCVSGGSMYSNQKCIPPCPSQERYSPFEDPRMFQFENKFGTDNVLMIPCRAPCSKRRVSDDFFLSVCDDLCEAPCAKKKRSIEPFLCGATCEASCSTGGGNRNVPNNIYNSPKQPRLNSSQTIGVYGREKENSKLKFVSTSNKPPNGSWTTNFTMPRRKDSRESSVLNSTNHEASKEKGRKQLTSFPNACYCSQNPNPESSGKSETSAKIESRGKSESSRKFQTDGNSEFSRKSESNRKFEPSGSSELSRKSESNRKIETNGNGRKSESNRKFGTNGNGEFSRKSESNRKIEPNGNSELSRKSESNRKFEPSGSSELSRKSESNRKFEPSGSSELSRKSESNRKIETNGNGRKSESNRKFGTNGSGEFSMKSESNREIEPNGNSEFNRKSESNSRIESSKNDVFSRKSESNRKIESSENGEFSRKSESNSSRKSESNTSRKSESNTSRKIESSTSRKSESSTSRKSDSSRRSNSFLNSNQLSPPAEKYSTHSTESGDYSPFIDCIPNEEEASTNEPRDIKVPNEDDNDDDDDNVQTSARNSTQNISANLESDPNIPPPFDLEVLHLTSIEALLISWRPPRVQDLHGYEVYMDGAMVKRVSRHRTTALLRGIECSCDVAISVFTVTRTGRSLEAATCPVPFIRNQNPLIF